MRPGRFHAPRQDSWGKAFRLHQFAFLAYLESQIDLVYPAGNPPTEPLRAIFDAKQESRYDHALRLLADLQKEALL